MVSNIQIIQSQIQEIINQVAIDHANLSNEDRDIIARILYYYSINNNKLYKSVDELNADGWFPDEIGEIFIEDDSDDDEMPDLIDEDNDIVME